MVVEAGDGITEADGVAVGEAGGQLEHAAFAARAGEAAAGESGYSSVPVDGGHRRAVAGAAFDEPGGEVVPLQERAVADQQGDAGFE